MPFLTCSRSASSSLTYCDSISTPATSICLLIEMVSNDSQAVGRQSEDTVHGKLWSGAVIATPSYTTYARFHRRTAQEQLSLDERAWDHDGKANFTNWNSRMRGTFHSKAPWFFKKGKLIDQHAYDAWLTSLPLVNHVDPEPQVPAVETQPRSDRVIPPSMPTARMPRAIAPHHLDDDTRG